MVTYIIFCVMLVITLYYIIFSARKKYFLEKSLYQFRQSKHELIMYMSENATSLDKNAFNEAKALLYMFNTTIQNYSQHHQMFLSMIKVVIINTIITDQKFSNAPNKHLEEFSKGYTTGIRYSLEAVPFLKVRLILTVIKAVFKILAALGATKLVNWVSRIETFSKAEDNIEEHCLAS